MNNTNRPLIELTREQDYRYVQLFELAMGMGMDENDADRDAWAGLCEEWPQLNKLGRDPEVET